MSSTVETATDIRPFEIDFSEDDLADLRRRIAGDALARAGDRRRSVAGRTARDDPDTRSLLGH